MMFTAVSQMIVNTSVVIMIFALCFLSFIFLHQKDDIFGYYSTDINE